MLDKIYPIESRSFDLIFLKWQKAWSLQYNTVWWDAEVAWHQCNDPYIMPRQQFQHHMARYAWWSHFLISRYDHSGIWDWHTDSDCIKLWRNYDDHTLYSADRSITVVMQGQATIKKQHTEHVLESGYGVAMSGREQYCLQAASDTLLYNIWGMWPCEVKR